jgi:hypothetical protein
MLLRIFAILQLEFPIMVDRGLVFLPLVLGLQDCGVLVVERLAEFGGSVAGVKS